MASGTGWADGAWVDAGWVSGAWASGGDVTAPILTLPTGVGVTPTTITISVTTDTAEGDINVLVSANASESAPTIEAGSTPVAVSSAGVIEFADLSGATAGSGPLYSHWFQDDASAKEQQQKGVQTGFK